MPSPLAAVGKNLESADLGRNPQKIERWQKSSLPQGIFQSEPSGEGKGLHAVQTVRRTPSATPPPPDPLSQESLRTADLSGSGDLFHRRQENSE